MVSTVFHISVVNQFKVTCFVDKQPVSYLDTHLLFNCFIFEENFSTRLTTTWLISLQHEKLLDLKLKTLHFASFFHMHFLLTALCKYFREFDSLMEYETFVCLT